MSWGDYYKGIELNGLKAGRTNESSVNAVFPNEFILFSLRVVLSLSRTL